MFDKFREKAAESRAGRAEVKELKEIHKDYQISNGIINKAEYALIGQYQGYFEPGDTKYVDMKAEILAEKEGVDLSQSSTEEKKQSGFYGKAAFEVEQHSRGFKQLSFQHKYSDQNQRDQHKQEYMEQKIGWKQHQAQHNTAAPEDPRPEQRSETALFAQAKNNIANSAEQSTQRERSDSMAKMREMFYSDHVDNNGPKKV